MTPRCLSLSLWIACATCLPAAQGAGRVDDTAYVAEVERLADVASALERDLDALAGATVGEQRFNLHWTSNQLIGTWLQVDLLQILLERSAQAAPYADDEELRDQGQFALCELDRAIAELEENHAEAARLDHERVNVALRTLLAEARTTVLRVLADRTAR